MGYQEYNDLWTYFCQLFWVFLRDLNQRASLQKLSSFRLFGIFNKEENFALKVSY